MSVHMPPAEFVCYNCIIIDTNGIEREQNVLILAENKVKTTIRYICSIPSIFFSIGTLDNSNHATVIKSSSVKHSTMI